MHPGAGARFGWCTLKTMHFQQNVPIATYTTLGIGGPARWFAEAVTEADVVEAADFARDQGIPLFILGGGSNLLVSDEGFPGLVLRIAIKGIETLENGTFSVAAGEDWDAFVSFAVERNCGGIECLAGIPGTVGGTPVQNVGAYGQEVAQTIHSVRVFDMVTRQVSTLDQEACGFSYRQSRFNSTERGRFVVLGVEYALMQHALPRLIYPDLIRYFKDSAEAPTLLETSAAVREIRRSKGMLLVDGDPGSAGSFFKNPIVPVAKYEEISQTAGDVASVPHFAAGEGQVKIPAAWLLEHAGYPKGLVAGKVGTSTRHTLALINRGGALARDMAQLRDRIIAAVEAKFGIRLEPEPVWVGPEVAAIFEVAGR